MRGFLSRLWWAMPWLQDQAARFWAFVVYLGQVVRCAWSPTWRFLSHRRVDIGLVVVGVVITFYRAPEENPSFMELLTAIAWGLAAVGSIVVVVACWNLMLAPYRAYAGLREESSERIATLEEENRKWRYPQEQEERITQKKREAVALEFGTELRAIRRVIEIVRACRPQPHYSRSFQLPSARFSDHQGFLAREWPEVYRPVEMAYEAAHHVNLAVEQRRTRAATPTTTIGVLPDDGLDEAYEAAGIALDALGEERGDAWEPEADRVARLVAEDFLRDAATPSAADPSAPPSGPAS